MVTHVKGHQDKETAYELLPIEAQLNVDADAVATLYQTDHGATRFIVPMIAGNEAQLLINAKTVTYGYVKTIRNAYAYPLLHSYIGKRNQWSTTTLNTIDWTSLGTPCNRHHHQRHFVVKLSHDLLPTRSRTKKYRFGQPYTLHLLQRYRGRLRSSHAMPTRDLCNLEKRPPPDLTDPRRNTTN